MITRACYPIILVVCTALPAAAQDHPGAIDRSLYASALSAVPTVELAGDWLSPLGEVQGAVGDVRPVDAGAVAGAVAITNALERGELTEANAAQWMEEHNIALAELVTALDYFSISWPMDRNYRAICAAIWEKTGDDIETYLAFPPQARIVMAIYLGVLGREDDVKKLLSTLSPTKRLGVHVPHYLVASQLYTERKSLPTAIWAWQRASEQQGPKECVEIAWIIRTACAVLDDAEVVRQEFLPWLEDKLEQVRADAKWGSALSSLVWAYDYVGEPEKAAERGRYWLQQAQERGVPDKELDRARRRLAEVLAAAGDVEQAAEIVAPQFEEFRPDQLVVWQQVGEETTRTVLISGNLTFKVTGATCELPSATTVVGERQLDERGRQSHYVVKITFGPRDEAGAYETTLVLQTNDPEKATITVPVTVKVSTQ